MGQEFETIKRVISAEQVARYYGLEINSRTHRARCPIHNGEHENLSFYGMGFRCFVCGEHGTSIDFAMKYLGIPSAMQAARRLDRDFNLGLFDIRPIIQPTMSKARAMKAEQLEKAFCRWCGRMYAEWRDAALRAAYALNGSHRGQLSKRERRIHDKMRSLGRKYALMRRFLLDVDAGFIEAPHTVTVTTSIFHRARKYPLCSEMDIQRLYRLFAEDRKAVAGYCEVWKETRISPAMREDITRMREVFALDD